MTIQFTAIDKKSGHPVASGEIEFPDDMPAAAVGAELQTKAIEIAFAILDVQFAFKTDDERKAFQDRLKAEQSGIVGMDGQPARPGKLITLNGKS